MSTDTTPPADLGEHSPLQPGFSPVDRAVFLENHQPHPWTSGYHVHPSIEINFLSGCRMSYSFSGQEIQIPEGRFCIFWAAYPHSVTRVEGNGEITNAHVALAEFLRWSVPEKLASRLLAGTVIAAKRAYTGDHELTTRWSREVGKTGVSWQQLHALEIQSRLYRLSVDGWDELLTQKVHKQSPSGEHQGKHQAQRQGRGQNVVQFERMLRFVADNYAERITADKVAQAADISRNHANTIFRRMLGRTIKEHVMDLRLQHARMLLTGTDSKTLTIALNSGFGSVSAFYEAFQSHFGIPPAAFRKGYRKELER